MYAFGNGPGKNHYEVCRRCINDIYGAHLQPKHCLYNHYRYNCPRCGSYSHIVRKITFVGYLNLVFRKRKANEVDETT